MQKTYAVLGLILAAGLSRGAPLFGAEASKPEEQIRFTADSLSMSEKGTEIEGKGNVEIKRQEMTLRADRVWANRLTNDMEATGNVSIDDPEWKLKFADRVRFNLNEEIGSIENGDLFLEQGHVSLSGRRLEKYAGQSYHIDEGIFTTCLCEDGPPTWKISAAEIDVTREGSGRIRRGVFYIMDVPVFYLPYAIFPVKTERQTGFLFPEFGTSTKNGFRYMQPFYWAITKSSDATLSFETETRARIGFLTEYRQMFSRNAQAQINLTYFNESFRDNPDAAIKNETIAGCHPTPGGADCDIIPQNRWSVIANHRQTAAAGWTTYSDVALVSDDFYVRELARTLTSTFDRERDIKTSRYSLSRAGFLRHWGDTTLQGEWDYYQDFIQADKRTLHRTPHVSFTGRQVLWNTPLELRWRAAGVNYLSQEGADGLRVDLRPELVLPFSFANYLHGAFGVAPRETAYHLYDPTEKPLLAVCTAGGCRRVTRRYDHNSSRELVELNGKLGTSFGRVFEWGGEGLKRIKHVVEPEVSYLFVSRSNQSETPIMDGIDRVNRRNLMTFSLTNRFWGRFSQIAVPLEGDDVEAVSSLAASDTTELGTLKFTVNYDVADEKTFRDRISDVNTEMRLRPKDYLALGVGTGVSPYTGKVNQATALFSIFDPRPITRRVLDRDFMRPNSLDLSYRFIGKTVDSPLNENANLVLIDRKSRHSCPPPGLPPSLDKTFDPRCGIEKDVMGLIGLRGLLHLTDHLLFLYDANYNAIRAGFTTNRGALKILSRCECWTLTFSLNRTTNPNETNFKFSFELLGLGSQAKEAFR
ncbi:MAG TPA: LPS assembly protein LptD [Candidatus Binatia bacterium]